MTIGFKKPVLLVEGDGDRLAVPELIRQTLYSLEIYDVSPVTRPIKTGDVKKIRRPGNLEKFISYGCSRSDGDSVLLLLDCDDDCPLDVAREFWDRVTTMSPHFQKKVGMGFFRCEFESLYLASIQSLVEEFPEYGWTLTGFDFSRDVENIRGAKELLSNLMSRKNYKETRDQVKFIAGLDFEQLRKHSRSFRHFEKTLLWLTRPDDGSGTVYPAFFGS